MNENMDAKKPATAADLDAQELLRAAESLDRLALIYRHVTLASEAMKKMAVVQGAALELEGMVAAKTAELTSLAEKVQAANQAIEDAAGHAEGVRNEAMRKADQRLEAAQAQAADVLKAAGERAAEVAAEGQAEREANIAKAQAVLNELGEQIGAARENLEQMAQVRQAKANELDAIEVKIQQARAAAAQILTAQ